MVFLFAAYAVVWMAVLAYSFSIQTRQKALQREIEIVKALLAERESR